MNIITTILSLNYMFATAISYTINRIVIKHGTSNSRGLLNYTYTYSGVRYFRYNRL